ncbi:MAG: phosphoribulokinase [Cyanobacteria bacterium J06641_5]
MRRIILGIVGDSAAGKTTLTRGIAQILGEDKVTVICTDDYHRYDRKQRAELGVTALAPEANYVDIMTQHLALLRQGQPILKPIYNHSTGEFDPPEYIEPRQFVIIEGLLGYSARAALDYYDVKVYLAPPEELRAQWKIKRDMRKRGYTEEQVRAALRQREPDSEQYIRPQRKASDLVVTFYPPAGTNESGSLLNVRLVLRPTIPHPDLSPLFEKNANHEAIPAIRLELARDMGKPVDVLEIDGHATKEQVREIEKAMCSEVPSLDNVCRVDSEIDIGKVVGTTGETIQSFPLAITQLLMTYHMLKASSLHQANVALPIG